MQTQEAFVWIKHWYPLSLEADLDTQKPTQHTLLNIDMVIWKDGEGKWGACEDRCPHRSAATALPDLCMLGTKTAHTDFAKHLDELQGMCAISKIDASHDLALHTAKYISTAIRSTQR